MYAWPSHFPQQCPPASAVDLAGTVYRFVNGRSPVNSDFTSHYERDPTKDWGVDACKARGLSILRTWEDCQIMRRGVPALRKKRVAVAGIETSVGLVAVTASNSCDGHCTWWRHSSPESVRPFFQMFAEASQATHA